MKKIVRIFSVLVLFGMLFTSCGKSSNWNTDLDNAKKVAKKQNKDIILLFSGDDWSSNSLAIKQVLETKEIREYFDDYIFANVDFSQEELNLAYSGTPGKKPSGKATKIIKKYEGLKVLAQTYAINAYPSVVFISYEGIVLSKYPNLFSVLEPNDFIEQYKSVCFDEIVRNKQFVQNVRDSRGLEKLIAIDNLCQNVSEDYSATLKPFVLEAVSLDSDNESGLLGIYELRAAYIYAVENMEKGKDPAQPFDEAIEKGHLTDEMIQEAYFNAAYALALSGSEDLDRMLDYLNKSYEAAPQSVGASEIKKAITTLETAKNYNNSLTESAEQ